MRIRKGRIEDAYDVAVVHVASWQTTYKNIIDDSYLAAMSVEAKVPKWEMILREGDVFVVENNENEIVGFAGGGPERSGTYTGYTKEVYSIYLLEAYQGQGIGRKLLTTVIRFLAETNHESILIWVLAENSAVEFYEAMGGKRVGQEYIDIGKQRLIECAYGWKDLRPFLA